MFGRLRLRNKILVPITVVCILVFGGIMMAIQMQIQQKSEADTRQLGASISARYAGVVQGKLAAAVEASKVMAASMATEASQPAPDRAVVIGLLHRTLDALPEFFGAWCTWEPDAFDGRDAEFVNHDALHEGTGRLLPYVIRGESGLEDTHTLPISSASHEEQRKWYWQPLQTGKLLLTEPTVYKVAGKDRMMISVCVPMLGKGVAGLDLSLGGLQHLVADIRIFDSGYGMLLSDTGTVVAHNRKEFIGKKDDAVLDEANRSKVEQALRNGSSCIFSQKSATTGESMLYCMTPVPLEGVAGAWSFVVAIPESAMYAGVRAIRGTLLWLSLGGLALLFVAVFFIARTIVRPIRSIMEATQAVADGDLDRPIDLDQRDEIGHLAESLRTMVASLKAKIVEADEKTRLANEESQRAAKATREAEEAKAAAEQAMARGMLQAAGRLEDVVGIVGSASEELSAQVEQSARAAEQQAAGSGETATAMEEMTATVIEIAKNASSASEAAGNTKTQADEGAQVVSEVVKGIGEAREQALELKADMTELGRQAENIGQILNVITDIADQTNLLALNAAIEAARAGDAGRGFAVVADEVRKLAEKTMVATRQVNEAITAIQAGTRKNVGNVERAVEKIQSATTLAEESGRALTGIVSLVEATSAQVASIATAAEQQSSTCEEINRSVEGISRLSSETSEAMSQSTRAVTELAGQAQELASLVASLKAEASEASAGAEGKSV